MYTEQQNNPDGQFQSVRDINKELLQDTNPDLPIQPPQQQQQQQQQKPIPPINLEQRGQIIKELSLNRKSEGFQQSKTNQEQIIHGARQHMLCMNIVLEQLDQRVALSDRSLQSVAQFLRERILQEQNNIKLLTNKNPPFIHIYKIQEKSIYPKLTSSLEYLNQLHQSQGKSLQILITTMDKMIKDKFENNQSQYSKAISQSMDKIQSIKKTSKEFQHQIAEKTRKFLKIYDEMMSNGGTHKKRSKDLFNQERKFKSIAQQQLLLQTKMGEEIIVYYNEVIKQETQRLEIIIQGLKFYIEKFNETYSGTTPGAQVQLVLQKFKEYNPMEECNTIDFTEINFIKEALKCEVIGFPQLKNYLVQFPTSLIKPTLAQTNPFILKFFIKIQRDVGTMLTKWQPIIAVVSIDRNLLIFDSEDTSIPNQKASYKFAIEYTQIIPKSNKGPLTAELKHTVPGMLFNSHQSLIIKLHSQDELEELQFYLTQNKK